MINVVLFGSEIPGNTGNNYFYYANLGGELTNAEY